ncbi:MAG TPA: hypothetical protein GX742_04160 [Acholeplasmataceae bacterium]|nr:hypothetical protein [Acholeplasmataceae bacterium]
MKMMISNSHINEAMEMKIVAIINAIQDIEGLHIERLGEFSKYINENKIGVFLTYRQIDIFRKPIFNTEIKIQTYPYDTNSISGYRQIYFKDQNDQFLIKSVAFGAFVDLISGRTVRLPKNAINAINDYKKDSEMELLPRKIDVTNQDFKFIKEITVEKSKIDRYKHLNNAFYVEYAINLLKDINKYNRIRAEYLKPLVADELVKLSMTKEENNKVLVKLSNTLDETNAIIEFSKVNLSV